MRAILIPVADRPECHEALISAFELAEKFSGNVLGYHLRPHKSEPRRKSSTSNFSVSPSIEWRRSTKEKDINLGSRKAEQLFKAIAEDKQFTLSKSARYREEGKLAFWHESLGDPDRVFTIIGPMSDLIVVSRPKNKRSERARAFLQAALFGSGRPVLILPHRSNKTIGENILIAWNGSRECSHLMTSCISLMQRASTVTVLVAGTNFPTGPSVQHLKRYLALYNITAKVVKTPGKVVEDEIVETYIEKKCDLLLMGAYSRPTWREQIFGGVTDHIIHKTSLPTVLLHR